MPKKRLAPETLEFVDGLDGLVGRMFRDKTIGEAQFSHPIQAGRSLEQIWGRVIKEVDKPPTVIVYSGDHGRVDGSEAYKFNERKGSYNVESTFYLAGFGSAPGTAEDMGTVPASAMKLGRLLGLLEFAVLVPVSAITELPDASALGDIAAQGRAHIQVEPPRHWNLLTPFINRG